MKRFFVWSALLLGLLVRAGAIDVPPDSVAVSFEVDGNAEQCEGFQVELRFEGQSIKPKLGNGYFEVPSVFKARRWSKRKRVDITLTCSGHSLFFPNQYPAFIQKGSWRLGIAYPLYALREYGYTHAFDRGTWLGYVIFDGEPGVVTFSSQADPPPGLSESLQKEQPNALNGRQRDIAYVLAVLNVNYEKNRDYLLSTLNSCLGRPRESPEDDVCDGDLLKFVTNLYWRGDDSLLYPLLQIADRRRDVLDDLDIFYADLLRGRGSATLTAIGQLPVDKQLIVCGLAADDLRFPSQGRDRVTALLQKKGSQEAIECLRVIKDQP